MAIMWAWIWAQLLLTTSPVPINKTSFIAFPVNLGAKAETGTPSKGHSHHLNTGDSMESRTASTVVSLICISLLSGMVGTCPLSLLRGYVADASGSRIRQTDLKTFKALSLCHYLVWALYAVSLAFVFSAAILVCRCDMQTNRDSGSNKALLGKRFGSLLVAHLRSSYLHLPCFLLWE
jgi:hypothetical protein